jgi:hypothetical protein
MLGSMLNYTPSINVGPISTQLPAQVSAISKQAPRTAQQQSFNLPAYMRQNTSQGQWNEMNRSNQDRYRSSLATGQNQLGRQMQQANTNQTVASLGAANDAADGYYDVMSNAMQADRNNRVGWYQGLSNLHQRQMAGPLGSLFGNIF